MTVVYDSGSEDNIFANNYMDVWDTGLQVYGNYNTFTGNRVANASTEFDISGNFNIFSSNNCANTGGGVMSGKNNVVVGNILGGAPNVIGTGNIVASNWT